MESSALRHSSSALEELTGSKVIIRTVTYHYVGLLVTADPDWLTLEQVSWVADSGRWGKALASGELNEVEPYPGRVIVGAGTVVDISEWSHDLPRTAK